MMKTGDERRGDWRRRRDALVTRTPFCICVSGRDSGRSLSTEVSVIKYENMRARTRR